MQVTSLLTDLKLLASSSMEEEHDKAFYTASWQHYSRVRPYLSTDCWIQLFNAEVLQEADAVYDTRSAESSYMQVIADFDEEFSSFTVLAKSLQPSGRENSQSKPISGNFDEACHVALRFRASQKQLLWELMLSLLK